jgi:uncharacterized protein YjbJ (UPF0337 family)
VVLKRQRASGLLGWKLSAWRQQQQQQQTPQATKRIDYVLQEAGSAVNTRHEWSVWLTSRVLNSSRLEVRLMNKDELNGKVDKLKGKIKEGVGKATDNDDLRGEGIADEAAGNVEEGFGKARRKVGDALHDVAHKIKD